MAGAYRHIPQASSRRSTNRIISRLRVSGA